MISALFSSNETLKKESQYAFDVGSLACLFILNGMDLRVHTRFRETQAANHFSCRRKLAPTLAGENGIAWKCMAELGIFRVAMEEQEDRWRQRQGRTGSERNVLAPRDGHRSETRNGEFQ
jgi:hypothetical protein